MLSLDDALKHALNHISPEEEEKTLRQLVFYCDALKLPVNFLLGNDIFYYHLDLTVFAQNVRALSPTSPTPLNPDLSFSSSSW